MHSGDSACAIPPPTLPSWVVEVIEAYTAAIAERLDVRGLINVQYAVTGTTVYVIEANPRASRTVPFVAKATGVPLAKVATRVMLGATLADAARRGPAAAVRAARQRTDVVAVKEAVLPFSPVPGGRPGARPGDALDRRGDGHRPHVRRWRSTRPSWPPAPCCRPTARCSCRSPTPTSRPASSSPSGCASSASASPPPRAPPTTWPASATRSTRSSPRSARATARRPST